MTYNLKNLNVASLDFDNIVNSLISFLEVQPGMTDIDFRNKATTANLLINILATATAYNGVYAQFGFTESFLSTATLLESVISIGSNHAIAIPLTQSARVRTLTRSTIQDYQSYAATATDGTNVNFYAVNGVSGSSSSNEVYLYSGSQVQNYTNYDFISQSILLPYTIDPDTISFYVLPDGVTKSSKVKWTRVSKGNMTINTGNNYFTVINSANGYLVTNNFANATQVTTNQSVIVTALVSTGSSANGAVVLDPNVNFDKIETPYGGFNTITVDTAKAKMLFELNYDRCVTIRDYINAIVGSGISGTSDSTLVSVRTGDTPGSVNVYVSGLSSDGQSALIQYLSSKTVAGISVVYAH